MRKVLGEWLTSECGIDATVAGELVLAAHEVALQLIASADRESGGDDGFALRGDYDERVLKLVLVEPGPAGRARRCRTDDLSTILVSALVDRVEHQHTEWGRQVSLCRSATTSQVGEPLIH